MALAKRREDCIVVLLKAPSKKARLVAWKSLLRRNRGRPRSRSRVSIYLMCEASMRDLMCTLDEPGLAIGLITGRLED